MKSSRSVTKSSSLAVLFVPALDQWMANASVVPTVLKRWVRAGTEEAFLGDAYAAQLVLGLAIGPAPFNALFDGLDCSKEFLIQIELVSLQPDLNAVWAQPSTVRPDQVTRNALKGLLDDFGFLLAHESCGRMYVSCSFKPEVTFAPSWQIQGVSLDQLMPTGPDAKRWIALISESQILLHQLKAQGATTGGESIWPSGMGQLPEQASLTPRLQSLVATGSEFQGLGHWLGMPVSTVGGKVHPKASELVEWLGEQECGADENLSRLSIVLKSLMRRVRWGRLKQAELATQTRRWVLRPAQVWKKLGWFL